MVWRLQCVATIIWQGPHPAVLRPMLMLVVPRSPTHALSHTTHRQTQTDRHTHTQTHTRTHTQTPHTHTHTRDTHKHHTHTNTPSHPFALAHLTLHSLRTCRFGAHVARVAAALFGRVISRTTQARPGRSTAASRRSSAAAASAPELSPRSSACSRGRPRRSTVNDQL